MTPAKARANEVRMSISRDIEDFAARPDLPGQRIHVLFVGLYLQTTTRWLKRLEHTASPEFSYLVIRQFYRLYSDGVSRHLSTPLPETPRQWRKYHRLSRHLTIRSPISLHLLLLSFGVRAHVRHDLGVAIRLAIIEHQDFQGCEPDFVQIADDLIGPPSSQDFLDASLDYIALHRAEQSGWRRFILNVYAKGLSLLRPIWLAIFQSWRQAALADARELSVSVRACNVH